MCSQRFISVWVSVLVVWGNSVVVWLDDVGSNADVRVQDERYKERDTREHSKYKQTNGAKQMSVSNGNR